MLSTAKLWGLVVGAGILVAGFLAMLGTYYAYGQKQYNAGVAAEHERQVQDTEILRAQLQVYIDHAQAAEDASELAREAAATKAQADASLPRSLQSATPATPAAACDYPDPLRAEINAIKMGN